MIFEVEVLKVFLLVMVRFSGLILTAPILGSNNVPILAKAGLAGLSAMLMTPTIAALEQPIPSGALDFGIMAGGEMLIGMAIGLVMTMLFAAIQIGGQIIDMQSGFGLMNVFNPALETQFPIFGFFFFILAILYMLIINGHHTMIRALAATFDHIPLGGLSPHPDLLFIMAGWGTAMFYDGLMIAAPVAAAMLLAYITMGLMGKVVPQIHMFVVGFPITIATALLIVGLSTDLYIRFVDGMFKDTFNNVETLIRGMG